MSQGIRVLHVDDDESFRDLAIRRLERLGLEVETADGAATALEALEASDRIDCVVSDFDMGGEDGLELLEAVRERDPELPFVLFTGKGSEEIASEAISAGVTDYLQKELSTEQFTLLANRIERAVTERRTSEALEESERALSTLVSNLPGVVYRCRNDPDWPMEYVGGNVEELTGYEPHEFLSGGVRWGERVHPDDHHEVWDTVQDAVADRRPFEVTYRFRAADGERRWLREQGQPIFEGDADDPVALEGFVTDVTDRRRRERALAEYDGLVDAMGDPVYTTDAEGRFTAFNERAEELTGYDAAEVIGEHVSVLLDASELERGEAVIRELLADDGRSTATYDITVITADGERLELENHVSLLADSGRFRGTVGVLRRSDDSSNSRLRRLHEGTRELMAESDPDAIAARTTRAASEILGLPIATVRLERDGRLELAAATDETVARLGERSSLPADDTLAGEVYRTGEPRIVSDTATLEPLPDRELPTSVAYLPLGDHGVFVVASTERDAFDENDIQLATILAANAEAALDRTRKEAALRRERDDLAALFENIPDPTVEVAMRGTDPICQRVNPAFEEVFGYENDEVVGENLDDFILPAGAAETARRYNARIREGGGFHREVRRVTADGVRDFILHVVPHDVGEEATRGYAIYTDVTEQRSRERELARQNERLEEFASVVSHDLRNPLSVARGRLGLARASGDDGAEHFDAVEAAHERMAELIEGILALARQGELTDEPVAVDLAGAAETAWSTLPTGSLALEVADAPTVDADPERLRQLLENLFRNAVDHADGATRVRVGDLADGHFYVEDDGVGIPAADRESVLESGYSDGDGTGFGLAIVDTIAEAHGWQVAVAEGDASGARFEFRPETAADAEE